MSLIVERWHPFVIGMVVAIVYLSVRPLSSHVLPDTLPTLLSAIVSVAAIAVGFLATAKSILISADDKPIIKRAKEAGVYRRIVLYFRAAISWSFALSIASVLALLFDYRGLKTWDWPHAIGTAAWLWLATGAILSYLRIARLWYTVLDSLEVKQP